MKSNLSENNIVVGSLWPQKRNGKICNYCKSFIEFLFDKVSAGMGIGKSVEWCPKCKKEL